MTAPERPAVASTTVDEARVDAARADVTQAGGGTGAGNLPDVSFPDEEQIARLREAVQRDRTALDRIGLGLRALHNHPLFEGLPADFRRLIERLQNRESRDPA